MVRMQVQCAGGVNPHDAVIGSNVWLTSSVEAHTTVILEKPRLRMRSDELRPETNYQI